MIREKLHMFIGAKTLRAVEAMEKIDANARGIIFVTDEDGCLAGTLTDGDIRRWLIRTGDLNARVSEIMNNHPCYLCIADRGRAAELMKQEEITALPVLDERQQIVDIVFASDAPCPKKAGKLLDGVPVVVMAGGKGTRLYPYTKILPKPLIPIGDIPIIERIMERFYEYGVSKYYVTVNYKKSMIKSYFQELQPDYAIDYIEENKPLGTAGSLKLVDEKFKVPFFVTNCDILVQADYAAIYQYHKESQNAMTIVSALKKIIIPYGVLHSGEQGLVTSMEEKPRMSYFVNTGMYILNPDLIERIPEDTMFHMTDLANGLMQEGIRVGMYPVSEDSYLDMGEFEEMRRMEKKLDIQPQEAK